MATNPERHRSTSRPRLNRALSSQPTNLLLQDGPVDEEAAELLEEFVGTHQHRVSEINEDEDKTDEGNSQWTGLPWWKRPSPLWMLCIVPFSAMAQGATLAPKVELYTMLACRVIKPDIFEQGILNPSLHDAVSSHGTSLLALLSPNIPNIEAMSPSSCASDPTVQAAVAEISAAFTTTMGVLSLLTTAWWGALSDRKGRVFVMGISLLGLLVTDFNYVNVYYFSRSLPGGYWFLLVGPVVEGLVGGFSAATAAIHGYLADTTTEKDRSRIFSLSLGLTFTGIAVGPALGSLLIKATGKTISVFFAAGIAHLLYSMLIWFVVPESLSRARMQEARRIHEGRGHETLVASDSPIAQTVVAWGKGLFMFLSPLGVLFEDSRPNSNPLKKTKREWSLVFLAVAYGFTISLMASYSSIFQYAAANFGWDSVKLGYFVSLLGASRAIFLTVLLPVAIKLFKPNPLVIDIPASPSETEPLLSRREGSAASSSGSTDPTPATRKVLHSPTFELIIVRLSVFLEIVAYAFMALASTGTAFMLGSIMVALGVGFSPALQTVALALYARRGGRETGRLFGALSVIQALASQVLGPTVYGLVYMKTVAYFPRAIFIVSILGLIMSLFFTSLVRLPKDEQLKREIIASQHQAEDADASAAP